MLRKGKESDEKSENKGGEKMLDETLKSVKEAEAKATAVLQKAEEKSGSIVEEAKAKAKTMKAETENRIRTQRQDAEDAFVKDNETQLSDAEAQALKEVDALKQLIEPKRADAVKAVFGAVKTVSVPDVEGEFAIITGPLSEAEYEAKAAKLPEIISRIRFKA